MLWLAIPEALKILVTTLSVAFPFTEYYSMEALAEHVLALRHQHLWCLTTVVLHVVGVHLRTSMQMYNYWSLVFSVMQYTHVSQFLRLGCVLYVTALEAYWCTDVSVALLLSLVMQCWRIQRTIKREEQGIR